MRGRGVGFLWIAGDFGFLGFLVKFFNFLLLLDDGGFLSDNFILVFCTFIKKMFSVD